MAPVAMETLRHGCRPEALRHRIAGARRGLLGLLGKQQREGGLKACRGSQPAWLLSPPPWRDPAEEKPHSSVWFPRLAESPLTLGLEQPNSFPGC